MNDSDQIQTMTDTEIAAVTGGMLGGVIKTPVDPGMLGSGPAGWLTGYTPGSHFETDGLFGFAAETDSPLYFFYSISQKLYFSVMRGN